MYARPVPHSRKGSADLNRAKRGLPQYPDRIDRKVHEPAEKWAIQNERLEKLEAELGPLAHSDSLDGLNLYLERHFKLPQGTYGKNTPISEVG